MVKIILFQCIIFLAIGVSIGIFTGVFIIKQIEPIMVLSFIPTSAKPLNETKISAMIVSTEQNGNQTGLNLANGLSVVYNGTDIKSGDVLSLDLMIYQPLCSVNISNLNNENNTSFILQTIKDPRCQDGYKAIQVLDWHKLNQK